MNLALIQCSAGADYEGNVEKGFATALDAVANGADVLVFPELPFMRFFPQYRGSPTQIDRVETIPGPLTDRWSEFARRHGVVVVLNLYESDEGCHYDSSPVIDADGSILGVTRMMHITQYEGFFEQDYYDPGDSGALVYDTAHGRIGVAICYDRHFPEYMRALALQGADLVVIPQAGVRGEWPTGVFEAEIQAASFQNGYFAALANRVGVEDGLDFSGGSFITDPRGQVIARATEDEDEILLSHLDLSTTSDSPARTLFMRHRRPAEYSDGSALFEAAAPDTRT